MRKLIFIIACLFLILPVCDQVSAKVTDSRDIELRAKICKNDPCSILPVRAWIDGQMVYVSFWDLPSTATVIITNVESGGSMAMSFLSPERVSIPINGENGTYEILITYEEKVFIGKYKL